MMGGFTLLEHTAQVGIVANSATIEEALSWLAKGRSSAIDGRTTWHPGYAISQRIRKRVEEIFECMKTVGRFRRTRYRGLDRTGLAGYLVTTAFNLVRMARLLGAAKATPVSQAA